MRCLIRSRPNYLGLLLSLLAAAPTAGAQNDSVPANAAERVMIANTILSRETPRAAVMIDSSFRFVGRHVVDLYGNAEAEQFLFVAGSATGPVDRFCWVQFEHFLPSNSLRYDSNSSATTTLGDLTFLYDVWAYTDYSVSTADLKSDGAAAAALLAAHGLRFPTRVARVRLFYFPTPDRRREVMIIYGESVPDSSRIPVTGNRVPLDRTAPHAAAELLAHARTAVRFNQR
jgi:hypothetical protein